MHYTSQQINALELATAKYEYMQSILEAMASTTDAMVRIHRRCSEGGWTNADKLHFQACEINLKAYKMEYKEAYLSNIQLNSYMFD